MKAFLKKIYLKIYTKPLWFSLLLFILLIRFALVIPVIFYVLIYGIPDETDEHLISYDFSDSLFKDIISGGIISPIIETLLFQTFLIWVFHKACKFNYFTTVVLSGFIFGLSHAIYSVFYALCACTSGLIFAFAYVLYTKKYSSARAFWLVAGIHAFNNISAFVIHWLGIGLYA